MKNLRDEVIKKKRWIDNTISGSQKAYSTCFTIPQSRERKRDRETSWCRWAAERRHWFCLAAVCPETFWRNRTLRRNLCPLTVTSIIDSDRHPVDVEGWRAGRMGCRGEREIFYVNGVWKEGVARGWSSDGWRWWFLGRLILLAGLHETEAADEFGWRGSMMEKMLMTIMAETGHSTTEPFPSLLTQGYLSGKHTRHSVFDDWYLSRSVKHRQSFFSFFLNTWQNCYW